MFVAVPGAGRAPLVFVAVPGAGRAPLVFVAVPGAGPAPLVFVAVPGAGRAPRARGRCVRGRVEQQGGPLEGRAPRILLRKIEEKGNNGPVMVQ